MNHAETLRKTARDHGITLEVTATSPGPTVTAYRLTPAPGVKPSKVAQLTDSWTLAIGAPVRYLGPQNGHLVVEVPNESRRTVSLEEMPTHEELTVPFGVGIDGPMSVPLATMPHLLVAGATGQGKSVYLNAVLTSLIEQAGPDRLSLLLVDPKRVELAAYADLPHLLLPVARDVAAAREVLEHAVGIMDQRYRDIEAAGVKKASELDVPPPALVVVIDELADLMMTSGKATEDLLVRLAGVGRAASVHLIVATQYPKKEVITSLLKQNIPTKIAFTVNDHVASNLILGMSGAEQLIGKGDALVVPNGSTRAFRVQAPMVQDAHTAKIVASWAAVAPIEGPAVVPDPVALPRVVEGKPVDEVIAEWSLRGTSIHAATEAYDRALAEARKQPDDDIDLLRRAYLRETPGGLAERVEVLERKLKETERVVRQFERLLRVAGMLDSASISTGGE